MDAIEVLGQTEWRVHHGGCNNASGGAAGLLTKCRLGGVVFYVRENLAGKGGMANVSSNHRLALKRGGSHGLPDVLELLAPAAAWDRLAEAVRAADPLRRPVRRNRRFTAAWARGLFQMAKDGAP